MTNLLKDLPIGSKVIDLDSSYKGKPIVWIVVDKNHSGYPLNSVTLLNQNDSPKYMGKASGRTLVACDYVNSHLSKWLNSDVENYNYYNEPGFLYNFSSNLRDEILKTKIKVLNSSSTSDINGYVDREIEVFIPAKEEVLKDCHDPRTKIYPVSLIPAIKKYTNNIGTQSWADGTYMAWARDPVSNEYRDNFLYEEREQSSYSKQGWYHPMINVNENIKVTNTPNKEYLYEIIWNQPPSKPSSFSLPEKAISRSETDISWTKSTDPENDPISYKLERSLDGGGFMERYKGSFTRYKDIIEDKGHKAVVYRVTAIDSNGNLSESLVSASIPISDNTIPTIETTSADLGKITAAYSVSYKVVDPDEGQTWTVTESLDGKELKTFTASVGTSYTSKLSAGDWQKVLNGKHILKIEAVDSDGGKSSKEISFEKAINKLDFMLDKTGVQGIDKMPERAILSMSANIPAEASIKVEITNNALDDKPIWQDCTAQVLGNEKIFFSNKSKTATKWAVNVRVTGDKKTATEVLSVSIIGGFYD